MAEVPGRKKILLHLQKEENIDQMVPTPFSYCQEGIAEAIELSQNRVSKLLEEMKENGLVKEKSGEVEGSPQQRNTYFLTDKGEEEAKQKKQSIGQRDIKIKTENGISQIKLKEIKEYVEGPKPLLFALNDLDQDGVLDLTYLGENNIFVNRDEELSFLKEYVRKTKSGNSQTILIEGYIGVGKTRLIEEFERSEAKEIDVYKENGNSKSDNPYLIFQDLFSKILDDLDEDELKKPNILELFNAESAEERIIDKSKELLEEEASKRPIMIFLDDIQSIDTKSLELFKSLTEETDKIPILLLGAYREKGDEKTPHFEELIRSDRTEVLNIDPLDWKQTRSLLTRKIGRRQVPDGFVDMIQNITEGVPLFIEAVIDEMLDTGVIDPVKGIYPESLDELELPDKIKKVYDKKLNRLDEGEEKVLNIRSCMIEDVSEDLLVKTMDGSKEIKQTIKSLKAKNLFEASSKNKVNFVHPMIRFTIYESLREEKKKEFHTLLAETLEELVQNESSDLYFRIARHHEKGGKLENALRSYKKAANQAEKIYENQEAIRICKKILELLEENQIQNINRNDIHEKMADMFKRIDEYEKALDHVKTIKKKFDDLPDRTRCCRKQIECLRNMRRYDEALDLIEKCMTKISQTDQLSFDLKKEKCKLLKEKGMIQLRKNQYDESRRTFLKMKRIAKKLKSKKDEAEAIHYLGSIDFYRSDFYEAKEKLERAIELRDEIDNLKGLSESYTNLGVVYRKLQEPREALEYYKKANEIEKEIGSEEGSLAALNNIGIVYDDLGELDKSIEYHTKCLEIEKKRGDKHGVASDLDNLGVIYSKKGEFDKAIEYHKKSLEKKKDLENRLGISFSYYNLGGAYRGKSEFEKAIDYFEKSLEIREELENRLNIGYSELGLGITYLKMFKLEKAEEFLERALELFKETKSDHGMGLTMAYLGKLNVMKDSMDAAEKFLEHSERIKSDLDEFRLELIVERLLAEYHLAKNRLEKALAYCEKSIKKAKESGMSNDLGEGKKVNGNIYHKKGIDWKATEEFSEAVDIFDETGDKKNKAEALIMWSKLLSDKGKKAASDKISSAIELLEECGLSEDYPEVDHIPSEKLS